MADEPTLFPNLTIIRRKSSALCPDCGCWMVPFSCRNSVIDKCPECQGIWFDRGELGLFRDSLKDYDLEKIRVLLEPRSAELHISACPHCGVMLEKFTYASTSRVRLRRCQRCGGIWSPLSETLRLIELARVSQLIEPDLRSMVKEMEKSKEELRPWKQVRDVGNVFGQRRYYRPIFPIVLMPLYDSNPCVSVPIVTLGLMALNTAVYISQGAQAFEAWGTSFPAVFLDGRAYTLITSQFIHADVIHLIGNLFFLWTFGDNVEDRMGKAKYFAFYLIGGCLASLGMMLTHPSVAIPMIGASGAISAVLGGYFRLFPSVNMKMLFWGVIVDLPAWVFFGSWFVFQALHAALSEWILSDRIGWIAHLTGFAVGYLGVMLLQLTCRQEGARAPSRKPPSQR